MKRERWNKKQEVKSELVDNLSFRIIFKEFHQAAAVNGKAFHRNIVINISM
jgi:hypothetical protein